jgi:hypothetical protein
MIELELEGGHREATSQLRKSKIIFPSHQALETAPCHWQIKLAEAIKGPDGHYATDQSVSKSGPLPEWPKLTLVGYMRQH